MSNKRIALHLIKRQNIMVSSESVPTPPTDWISSENGFQQKISLTLRSERKSLKSIQKVISMFFIILPKFSPPGNKTGSKSSFNKLCPSGRDLKKHNY